MRCGICSSNKIAPAAASYQTLVNQKCKQSDGRHVETEPLQMFPVWPTGCHVLEDLPVPHPTSWSRSRSGANYRNTLLRDTRPSGISLLTNPGPPLGPHAFPPALPSLRPLPRLRSDACHPLLDASGAPTGQDSCTQSGGARPAIEGGGLGQPPAGSGGRALLRDGEREKKDRAQPSGRCGVQFLPSD